MENTEKQSLRRDRDALESALKEFGVSFKGKSCRCPFHDDKTPSAGIYEDSDGVWRFKCQVPSCGWAGDIFDVRARREGKKPEDILREGGPGEPEKKIRVFRDIAELESSAHGREATYVYSNPQTQAPEMIVLRCRDSVGKKHFLQCRPYVDGGFVMLSPPKPWPLYNRTRLSKSGRAVVVEGEKCVHALKDVDVVATTSPGGAGKACYADWTPLAGKTVVLWPDNDETGIAHMREVACELEKLDPACQVSILDPEILGLPPKGDAVEYLELCDGASGLDRKSAIESALTLATPVGAIDDLDVMFREAIAGRRQSVEWPWPATSAQTKALTPGSVTLICGDPGSTKSLFLLEAMWFWVSAGVKVAIYEMEDSREFHLSRALAQMDDNSNLTDMDWVHKNQETAQSRLEAHRAQLNALGRCMFAAPDQQITQDQLIAWLKKRCEAGCRVIAIDPITAATANTKPWIDDLKFLTEAKNIVRRHGASLILVTHPKISPKMQGAQGLSSLSGGAAYSRFSHTVLWIECHDSDKSVSISVPFGEIPSLINRTLRLTKTRNGRGAGARIGFSFDPNTLRFAEHGTIKRKIRIEGADE